MISNLIIACGLACSVGVPSRAIDVPSSPIEDNIEVVNDNLPTDTIRLSNGAFADIQYQYGTNSVDNTSNDTIRASLVNGNIYEFVFTIPYDNSLVSNPDFIRVYPGRFSFVSSICVNGFVSRYTPSITTSVLDIRPSFRFGPINVFETYYAINNLVRSPQGNTDNVVVSLYASFPSYDDFVLGGYDLVINECPKERIPYNVIAIHQSENLYNIFYNFFFGMFDNTGLTQYELELMGVNTTFSSWLAHTFTIITFVLLFIVAILFLRWLFRIVSGIVLLKH